MANIGSSKHYGVYNRYLQGSRYSTQPGNQSFAGNTIVGGFNADGEYVEKYAGGNGDFGGGAAVSHANYEIFTRVPEKPTPPVFYD